VDGFGTVTASTLMAEERRERLPEVRVSWASSSLPCLPSPVSHFSTVSFLNTCLFVQHPILFPSPFSLLSFSAVLVLSSPPSPLLCLSTHFFSHALSIERTLPLPLTAQPHWGTLRCRRDDSSLRSTPTSPLSQTIPRNEKPTVTPTL
jgi:hypothetical protein